MSIGVSPKARERAKNRFEAYVDDEMTAWRLERYGTLALIPVFGLALAVGRWIDDQVRDINSFPEIIAIFRDGRRQYLDELEDIIRDISRDVDEALAWCRTRIQQGEAEIQTSVDNLPEAQRVIGERAANSISSRFDQLRGTVESRREELANRLAQRYQESREALDARIVEMQEENRGLVGQALDLIDSLVTAIQDFRTILPSIARHIPGYTLFTVVIGFNPLTGEDVDRNAINLLEGLMGLVPGGTFIFDTLQERGILQEAFQWVEGELGRLDLSQARIETTIDAAWEDIQIAAGLRYNIDVLIRHFGQLLIDVTAFAQSLVAYLIDLIKRTAIEILDELLAENQAWALIKKVLHHDPLKDIPVEATTAEIIEDFLMLIGKEQELEQMREQGTVQETADWLDTQLDTFLSLLSELGALFSDAWEAIQPENLPNLMSNLELMAPRVGGFLQRLWDFALVVAAKVFELIKNALLAWLRTHANAIPGYHLLTVILEKDVFTEEEVPRTPENLIRGFMSLVPGGEQQYQQMQETGVIPRVAARIESLITDLGISWPFIRDLFVGIWDSLSIEDLIDPIGAFTRIIDQFGEPLGRLLTFVIEVIKVVLELVLRMMGFPFELIESIIANAMQAIEDIRNDPVGFLLNMLEAVKLGFSNFFDNILTHLLGGLADWLFRGLRDAGVEPPADLTLPSILDFVLELLGISMERIWEKLAERIGQENVDRIRGALDMLEGILNFINDVRERGVVAIWEYIEAQISNLWDMILQKAQEWIMERIIARVTARLLSMLDPTGVMAVVNSFLVFFNAVQSAIEYLREILEIVNDWVTTIAAVARGDIQPGAQKMEQGLANAIPVAIGFLANQVGLGNIGEKMQEIIGGVREMIDQALDWLFDQAERAIQALLRTLGLGGEEEQDEAAGNGQLDDTTVGETISFNAAEEQHRLWIDAAGAGVQVMVASDTPSDLEVRIQSWIRDVDTLPEENQAEARSLLQSASQQLDLTLSEAEEAKLAIDQAQNSAEEAAIDYAGQQDQETEDAERQLVTTVARLFEMFELTDPEQVKQQVAEEVRQLPRTFNNSSQLLGALQNIFDRYEQRGLKKMLIRPDGPNFKVLSEASAAEFADYVAVLTERGLGGCSILVQIDGEIVHDDTAEGAVVVWNAGRGGPHAEARVRTRLLELLDEGKINQETDLIEIWIRYSPCHDRCRFILSEIENQIQRHHQLVRFRWYYHQLYVTATHTRAIAEAVVNNYQQQGIFIMEYGDAIAQEEIHS